MSWGLLSEHPGVGCTSEDLAHSFHSPQALDRGHKGPGSRTPGTHLRTYLPVCTVHTDALKVRGFLPFWLAIHPDLVLSPLLPSGWAFLRQPWSLLGGQLAGTLTSRWATWALALPDSVPGETPGPTKGLIAVGKSGFSGSLLPGRQKLCVP